MTDNAMNSVEAAKALHEDFIEIAIDFKQAKRLLDAYDDADYLGGVRPPEEILLQLIDKWPELPAYIGRIRYTLSKRDDL